ncbi:hypothetical protein ACFWH4_01755 [Streptomyces sp. NPDC127091]|uniref:Uncharacterized protein n=1 Tax=Streptomyces cathayae TaxID=3031124 RepID=A0ABY8JWN8_9ACTN|nr:hypothetical protein [Streptomyces sp. HUAS 5]WGD40201.1 hypothetical protein PYS65_08715 [Streptomyces sp. HUAS 5]
MPVGDDLGDVTEVRVAMWRSRLADEGALLIGDNAASQRQLEPLLLDGSECLLLATSRRRFEVHEEVVLPVEELPPDYAVDLFERESLLFTTGNSASPSSTGRSFTGWSLGTGVVREPAHSVPA